MEININVEINPPYFDIHLTAGDVVITINNESKFPIDRLSKVLEELVWIACERPTKRNHLNLFLKTLKSYGRYGYFMRKQRQKKKEILDSL